MIQFLVHEKRDTVGVAVVDLKAGQSLEGRSLDTNETVRAQAGDMAVGIQHTRVFVSRRQLRRTTPGWGGVDPREPTSGALRGRSALRGALCLGPALRRRTALRRRPCPR